MEIRYEIYKAQERLLHWFPKMIPARLRYWILVFEGARHIDYNEVVPEVPFMTILRRSGSATGD
jgi:hypothetical protein